MHFCLNAVTGEAEVGSAVLLRAGEPVAGESGWRRIGDGRSRATKTAGGDLAGGPGKLCQALGVGRELDGVPLDRPPLYLTQGEPLKEAEIVESPRIGVDYAGDAAVWPLRFSSGGNVSRPRPV